MVKIVGSNNALFFVNKHVFAKSYSDNTLIDNNLALLFISPEEMFIKLYFKLLTDG